MDYIVESLTRLLPGLLTSVQMTVVSVAIGMVLGFLGGLLLNNRHRGVRYPVIALVEVLRGFPALLTLYFVYFGLPKLDVVLDGFVAVVIAFGLTVAAYTAEIFRAAIASVPRGQREAALSLGLRRNKTIRLIVLPHVLRVAVPPLLGIVVIAFQGTSLAISIGQLELTGVALNFGMSTFYLLPEILMAGALYLIVTTLLTWVEIVSERRAQRLSGGSYQGSGRKRRRGVPKISTEALRTTG
ncbi:amino acid ABC transporter permease [Cryobacterium sp. PH29-G1]|uniref:amino acid ABC transporter permease n=1 Tax=Cryobacterium sp. PH29-G1 TaxID=3046211 RepID=UPI0024BA0A7F|nr:amino acid ABC transporter permease [Cryobacterium sp. PH29-G1]MDJ0349616.1 amino acid ABC transporter permease [Cryobacterium sp. PH29-G1]